MKIKDTMPTPKRRAIVHLQAKMKSGAGAHPSERKPGPSVEDWGEDEDEWEHPFAPSGVSDPVCSDC